VVAGLTTSILQGYGLEAQTSEIVRQGFFHCLFTVFGWAS
jgi:hypothetical protein